MTKVAETQAAAEQVAETLEVIAEAMVAVHPALVETLVETLETLEELEAQGVLEAQEAQVAMADAVAQADMADDTGYVIMPVVEGKIVGDAPVIFFKKEKLEELRNLLNAVLND